MRVVECPNIWEGLVSRDQKNYKGIFLAGGITGCPDWQQEFIRMSSDSLNRSIDQGRWDYVSLINPRRKNFPIGDPSASQQQITWERAHIDVADILLFWFPKETLCPITLFEYGAAIFEDWAVRNAEVANGWEPQTIIVGTHPDYERRTDIVIQTGLLDAKTVVHTSLDIMWKEVQRAIEPPPY